MPGVHGMAGHGNKNLPASRRSDRKLIICPFCEERARPPGEPSGSGGSNMSAELPASVPQQVCKLMGSLVVRAQCREAESPTLVRRAIAVHPANRRGHK